MYVCNCNGIRERDVLKAIEAGAERASEVFRHCQARPLCAKCVGDVQRMVRSSEDSPRSAAA
jgi:bacterioferritin-associated ferredoxin